MSVGEKHPHYHKDVRHLETIDVYRVLSLFNVTDPCIQHAVKKLLVAGGRGAGKNIAKDVQEAADSLARYLEMQHENSFNGISTTVFKQVTDTEVTAMVPGAASLFGIGDTVRLRHTSDAFSAKILELLGKTVRVQHADASWGFWPVEDIVLVRSADHE